MDLPLTDFGPTMQSFTDAITNALSADVKKLAPMHLYNERGSELFEEICKLESYYVTSSELEILKTNGEDIIKRLPKDTTIIELGSGSHYKIHELLESQTKVCGYMPIDISKSILLSSAQCIKKAFPNLNVHAICADYLKLDTDKINEITQNTNNVVYFSGSTIGNLSTPEMLHLLETTHKMIQPNGKMLLSIDLVKSKDVLLNAYDDEQNVSAAFAKNIIVRLSEELNVPLEESDFDYVVDYKNEQITMNLKAKNDLRFSIGDTNISISKGELITTECSRKYNLDTFTEVLRGLKFDVEKVYLDKHNYFAILLLQTAESEG